MKPPPRPKTSGANPDEDAAAEDITEFAHSAPTPPLLEPDDDERTLANTRVNPAELSADLDEHPFALVNPPLSGATLAELRAPELPAPSSLSTPPAGAEDVSRRSARRGGTGLLLGLGVLGLALLGLAVFFKSGQAASSTPVSPPLEAASVAHAEPSPPETAPPPSEPAEPASSSSEALEKAPHPTRTVSAAKPAAMPRPAVTSPAQSRAVTPTAPSPPIATERETTNPAPDRAHASTTNRPTSTDATETVDAPFDRNAAASALAKAAEEAAASCRKPGDPAGTASTTVTFAPSGRVTTALLSGPPFAGTQTGSCIAATLRRARIPAFAGEKVTVGKTIVIR